MVKICTCKTCNEVKRRNDLNSEAFQFPKSKNHCAVLETKFGSFTDRIHSSKTFKCFLIDQGEVLYFVSVQSPINILLQDKRSAYSL